MKNKFFAKFFAASVLSVAAFSFSGCGKKGGAAANDISAHIPSNASAVFILNAGQLMQKMDYAAVKQLEIFKKAIADAPEQLKPILEDPNASGLDLTKKWMGFVDVEQKEATTDMVVFMAPIKDAAKFEALIKQVAEKNNGKIEDKAGIKQISLDPKSVLAWNGSMLILVGIAEDAPAADKDTKIANFFKPAATSVNQNADFAKRNGENKDLAFWVNAEPIVKAMLASAEGAQIKTGLGAAGLTEADLMQNTFSAYQDFQNGKADGGLEYNFSAGLKKQYGAWFKEKPSQDFSKFLPAQNSLLALSAALDLKAIYASLAKFGVTPMADMQLAMAGVTTEQIAGAIGGEGAVSIHFDAANAKMPFGVSFVSTIADKAGFDKLVAIAQGIIPASGKFSIPTPMGVTLSGFIDDKTFAVGTVAGYGDKIAAGGYSGAEAYSLKNLQTGWLGFDMNIDALTKVAESNPDFLSKMTGIPTVGNPLASLKAYTQSFGYIGTKDAKAETGFKNTSKNSLYLLIELSNNALLEAEKAQGVQAPPM
jgi:hypothetical protein